MKKLITISTPLPPNTCGIGNYTAMLRHYWPEDRTQIIHLVPRGASASREYLGIDEIYEFQLTSSSLIAQLNRFPEADILLMYAGRGYNRFGCPYWLPLALQKWRRKQPERVLLVMFHELWASLPPWKKHFLTETLNQQIAKQLASLANVVGCFTPQQSVRLKALAPNVEISLIPVGTNILPTLAVDPSFANRAPKQFLIFGLQYTRILTISALADSVKKLYEDGRLEQLHLIGPIQAKWDSKEKEIIRRILPSHVVNYHGVLPAEKVSELLRHVGFCLLSQPPENLTKSGSFMAFASHGCSILSPYADLDAEAPLCYCLLYTSPSPRD